MLVTALKGLVVILVLFPIAAACSMAERKISAWIQGRPGPNRTIVPWLAWIPIIAPILQRLGLFQLAADGGKFLFKEDPIPGHVNKFYFVLAPIVAMIPAALINCASSTASSSCGSCVDASTASVTMVSHIVDAVSASVMGVSCCRTVLSA